MKVRTVFAIWEATGDELVALHPYADLQGALDDLYAYIEARAVDPDSEFHILEVGTDSPASSTGIAWRESPILRASVVGRAEAGAVH